MDAPNLIDTDQASSRLRSRMIHLENRSISLTNFEASAQIEDITFPTNMGGYVRVHTFAVEQSGTWPQNPLPIGPASAALQIPMADRMAFHVFQNSGCNWRCWYCFVPFKDLSGHGSMVSVRDMARWSAEVDSEPHAVDLSGGQPDLTPEWSVWFLEELGELDATHVYVWSDDNLSNDYLWKYLSPAQIGMLGEHPRYGRACCIKGHNADSFSFNTLASPALFDRQFELLSRLQEETSIDYYVYLTITSPSLSGVESDVRQLMDRLQRISETLPLRTVPLEVLEWGPVTARMTEQTGIALQNQYVVVEHWQQELERRFPGPRGPIELVPR